MSIRASLRPALTAMAVGAIAFTAYVFTLAPSVGHVDSGELAAACWTFGIAHPPGYPLYVLLAGVWAHAVPFGTVIERLNLFSALCSAAGIAFFVMALHALLGARRAAMAIADDGPTDASAPMHGGGARLFAAAAGGLALALSLAWWTASLRTDVYAAAMCVFALQLWLWTSVFFEHGLDPRRRMRRGIVASLCAGLSLSVHPLTIVMLPVVLFLYLRHYRLHGDGLRRFLIALPYFLLGLTPYALLVVRAAAGAEVNWGDPSTFTRFLDHVSAAQIRHLVFASWDVPYLQATFLAERFPREMGYPLLPLLAIGVIALFRRNGTAAWMALLLILAGGAWALNAPLLDVTPHFLPLFMGATVFLAAGIHAIAASRRRWLSFAGALYVLAALGLHGAEGYATADLSDDHVTEDYTRNIFESLRPRSLLLSDEWHVFLSPAMYFQIAEHARPDVTIIDTRLSRRAWYLAQLRARASEAVAVAGREMEAYLRLLDARAQGAPVREDSLSALHDDMLLRIVEGNMRKRPVCLTTAMDALIPPSCEAVPEGMVLHLYPQGEGPSPDMPVWDAFITRRPQRSNEYDRLVEGRYFRVLARRGYWLYAKERKLAADLYFARASGYRQFEATPRWRQWKLAMEAMQSSF